MQNINVLTLYSPFVLVVVFVFLSELSNRKKEGTIPYFLQLSSCILVWFFCEIMTFSGVDGPLFKMFWNLCSACAGFTPLVMLLFSCDFYHFIIPNRKLFIYISLIIPSLTVLFALSSPYHDLLRPITIISISPFREVLAGMGPWFILHCLYCYSFIFLTLAVMIYGYYLTPVFYRLTSSSIVLGIILILFSSIVTILNIVPGSIDLSLIASSLTIIIFYLVRLDDDRSVFVRYSRGQVFSYMDSMLLVLSANNRVVDANPTAQTWFQNRGISLMQETLGDIMISLQQNGAQIEEPHSEISFEGKNQYMIQEIVISQENSFPEVLQLKVHKIIDSKGVELGFLAIFNDITQNRMLIERLEAKAGVDALTGIANRMAFEGASQRLNAIEFLPLSIIVCDFNNLKKINDTYGHNQGDLTIRVVAGILEEACPKDAFVARLGGDEFIYLLPNYDYDTAMILAELISSNINSSQKFEYSISVALGVATKEHYDQDFVDVLKLADQRMYQNKKRMKG